MALCVAYFWKNTFFCYEPLIDRFSVFIHAKNCKKGTFFKYFFQITHQLIQNHFCEFRKILESQQINLYYWPAFTNRLTRVQHRIAMNMCNQNSRAGGAHFISGVKSSELCHQNKYFQWLSNNIKLATVLVCLKWWHREEGKIYYSEETTWTSQQK